MTTETLNRAINEAKRAPNKQPFVGSEQDYIAAYLAAKADAKDFNLRESDQLDFKWNKVLLKVQTVGQLRASDVKTRENMLLPWFRQGDACLLYAPAGIGKSFLSMAIGLAVAGSGTIKGLDWTAEDKRKVLLVDGEMPPADLKDRVELIVSGEWIDGLDESAADENFAILDRLSQDEDTAFIDLTKPDSQQLIGSLAVRNGIKLVILDNFSTLTETMRDENDAVSFKQLNAFISRLKRKGISVLLVHHANKEGFSFRGSSALSVTFDSIIGLHKVQTEANGATNFRLAFEKLRATPSKATATREVTMTSFGYSTGDRLQSDTNLKAVVDFVLNNEGKQVSMNKASKEDQIGLNRETIQKKLIMALDDDLLSAEQVVGAFGHLPSDVGNAVERSVGRGLNRGSTEF